MDNNLVRSWRTCLSRTRQLKNRFLSLNHAEHFMGANRKSSLKQEILYIWILDVPGLLLTIFGAALLWKH